MTQPIIGVFDSGVGGLTVLQELVVQLPNCSYIYFADNANCPYGPKGAMEIIRLAQSITNFLIENHCSIVVVACNTATAAAIDHLRSNFLIPFVGMEPAIKPAALATKTKSIGILATKGTFNGRLYQETSARYASDINTHYEVGEGLVELVEAGKANSPELKALLRTYVDPMLKKDIDHLVLGCSHYPFFIPTLKELLPSHVTVVNPAPAVAKQTARLVNSTMCENLLDNSLSPSVTFYASGSISMVEMLVKSIESELGVELKNKTFTGNIILD